MARGPSCFYIHWSGFSKTNISLIFFNYIVDITIDIYQILDGTNKTSVLDPDPVGSVSFGRIRIRKR